MKKISCVMLVSVMVCTMVGAQGLRRVSPTRQMPGQPPGQSSEHNEVGTLRTPQNQDPNEARRRAEEVHAWLMAEQVAKGLEDPLGVTLSDAELAEIEQGACEGCTEEPMRQRVGVAKSVLVEFAGDDVRWGAMEKTEDGGRVWSAAVRSSNAFGLRLHFDLFWLPEGVELYVFNEAGEIFGPYTGAGPLDTGEFWTQMVTGEEVYVQLRVHGKAGNTRLRNTYFDVVGVGHVGARMGDKMALSMEKEFCSFNAPCVENVECVNANSAVNDARLAVAHIQFVDGPYFYACSGGLVNNTANDGTPYFLTANHCLSTDAVASTLEAFFQWSVPCGSECPAQWSVSAGVPRTSGASVVKTNTVGDYTLLRLAQPAPPGSAFLGWTSEPVASTHDAMLYRISHPYLAPQAYSAHRVDTTAATCWPSWPRGGWIYSRDVVGATEGGSSGSPVVNADGRLVGQLTGVCGYNISDKCDAIQNAAVDGAFASYFDEVAPWLDPAKGGCVDADGDGHQDAACGGDDCDDTNASVYPGAEEVCGNLVDDDCDGTVDDGCAVCDFDEDGFDAYSCGGNDCDDYDPTVNPIAPEVCGDGIDNNCNDAVDEDCAQCDIDGDSFQADLLTCGGNDCDDTNASIYPGADEVCDNFIDDDCDGSIDGDDTDCATCTARKAPCQSNAECCSGKCHPKQLWCK